MKLRSLGTKIQIVAASVFLLGLSCVFSFQTYQRIQSTWNERMDANLRIVRGLAAPAREAILKKDRTAINSYMELLSSDARASGIVLTSANTVLVSQQSIDHFDLPITVLSELALEAEVSKNPVVKFEGEFEYIGIPVQDSALRTIGTIAVAWSTKGLLDSIYRNAISEALSMLMVLGFVLAVLVFTLRRLVTTPLSLMARLLEKPATENDPEVVATSNRFSARHDELGAFARALSQFYESAARSNGLNIKLDAALTNMSQGLCMFDSDGKLLVANSRFANLYNIPFDQISPGTTEVDLLEAVTAANPISQNIEPALRTERFNWIVGTVGHTTTHDLPDGKSITVSRQPTSDKGWVTTHTDVTDLRVVEKKLFHLANHDALTGLVNRRFFNELLNLALSSETERQAGIAVLFLDLDKFKAVNDTMGHAAGDVLLKLVAERLAKTIRGRDVICRMGGDEFAILQRGNDQPFASEALSKRIIQALTLPFDIEGSQAQIGVSIGVALSPQHGLDAAALLHHADVAVYVSKAEGRNTYRLYEDAMKSKQEQKSSIEIALRSALDKNEFELHYQPIVDLKTNQIICCEALIRWNRPDHGLINPNDFIPQAEECGLIVQIGEWVIRQACQQAINWPLSVAVSVNVSSVQLQHGDLSRIVYSALAKSQILPSRLHLEITESVLLKDDAATLALLKQLRSFGVRIVLDDFGTGYSTLSYLNKFDYDKIKIDRSFVNQLDNNNVNAAIIGAIVSISRQKNIPTVAEGVETDGQREHLISSGVDEMQGYLFSRPQPATEIEKLWLTKPDSALSFKQI